MSKNDSDFGLNWREPARLLPPGAATSQPTSLWPMVYSPQPRGVAQHPKAPPQPAARGGPRPWTEWAAENLREGDQIDAALFRRYLKDQNLE